MSLKRQAAIFAAIFGVMAPATATLAACQMIKNAELDVRFVGNRPLVEASINGKAVWIEVDTGAYNSALFAPAAARLGLKGYDTGDRAIGVGGEVEVFRVDIAEFALQNARVKNFQMDVAGGAHAGGRVGEDGREVVGLLGRDFLGLVDGIEFDLSHGKLRLLTFKDCGGRSLAYWSDAPGYVEMGRLGSKQAEFIFPLKINDYYVKAVLDSGAGLTVVSRSVAAHAGVTEADYVGKAHRTAGIGNKLVETNTATFHNIDLGDEKIAKAELQITDLDRGMGEGQTGSRVAGSALPMLLGADFLHSHRVLIASSQDRIYYSYEGGPVFHHVATDPPPPQAADH
jgi:predicted aspartyl protease